MLSLAAEIVQFVFAIGRTDITDVITNTLGGSLGLALYEFGSRYVSEEKLDQFITVTSSILLITFVLLRTLFLRVRYHSAH